MKHTHISYSWLGLLALTGVACSINTPATDLADAGTGGDLMSGTGGTSDTGGTSNTGSVSSTGGDSNGSDASTNNPDLGDAGAGATTADSAEALRGACEGIDGAQVDSTLSGSIASDTTLSGTIAVSGTIRVDNATVTIEPGTTFIMGAGSAFDVAPYGHTAAFIAKGTPDAPIRFCAETSTPGFWGQLLIEGTATSNSVLENVIISHGGGVGAALTLEASVLVKDVTIEASANDGVHAFSFKPGSAGLNIIDSGKKTAVLSGETAITNFPLDGVLEANQDNTAHIAVDGIAQDTTVHDIGIPYIQDVTVITDSVTIEVEAGVDYRFAADTTLEIGWNSNTTTLRVSGEQDNPVVFQGAEATSGYWSSLVVGKSVTTNSYIKHAEFRHGGGLDTYALLTDASITLEDVLFEGNENGARINAPLSSTSKNLTITGTGGRTMYVDFTALTSVPIGGSYTGNAADEIRVGGTLTNRLTGVVRNVGVPYHVLNSLSLEDGSDITIEPGTEFVMAPDTKIEVAWNSGTAKLTAVGTAADPIVFRGEEDTAGFWTGIVLLDTTAADSVFDYVNISNAGVSGGAALTLNLAVSVTNTTISKSAGAGIDKTASDATDYTVSNTFNECAEGNVI